jgi:glycerol-3-phosphate dehydrogenase (NAD(P)+)
LGAGSWGTALAMLLARNGHAVRLWDHDAAHCAQLAAARVNARYLPEAPFPTRIEVCADWDTALAGNALPLLAVPSHALGAVLARFTRRPARIAWVTKGLETGSARLPHQVVAERLGDAVIGAVISGPSFAGEVARGLPTAITVAARDTAFANTLAGLLHNEHFRAYTSGDMVGVELGGAVKNVLAIAAGISDGLGFGANARAALITRGLHELMRLGLALGASRETFMGLAGIGDLVLTCTDNQSRNRRLGLMLARGASSGDAAQRIGQVVEGVQTAREVQRLAHRLAVEMPICEQVHRALYEGLDPREAVTALMTRAPKAE